MGNAAFIDSQNLHLGVKAQGWELDFTRFIIYLRDKFKISKALLFIGYVPGNNFLYSLLQHAGYTLIFKPTLYTRNIRGEKVIMGNVDAELVLHAMIELPNYGKAIIVSGDGDFRCLIEYLSSINKLERLIIPNQKSYSSLLLEFKEYMLFITEDHKKKLGE